MVLVEHSLADFGQVFLSLRHLDSIFIGVPINKGSWGHETLGSVWVRPVVSKSVVIHNKIIEPLMHRNFNNDCAYSFSL